MSASIPKQVFSYREFQVEPYLQRYIRKFWVLDNLLNMNPLAGKQLLPNGCFNLAFIFGNGVMINQKEESHFLADGIYLCGQFTSATAIAIQANTKITLAQLYPWTPAVLTKFPLHEITDSFIPLEEPLPQSAHILHNSELFNEAEIKAYLSKKIMAHLANTKNAAFVEQSCLLLRNAQGDMSVKELATKLGYSTRTVEKKFKTSLGLRPKEFATILKVRDIIDELKKPENPFSLTEIAFKYGFYDQAHFIKTFRSVLNISPKAFNSPNYILPKGKGFS